MARENCENILYSIALSSLSTALYPGRTNPKETRGSKKARLAKRKDEIKFAAGLVNSMEEAAIGIESESGGTAELN